MTALRLVIFDCDGTLADSEPVIAAALGATFEAVGRPAPDQAAVRALIGLPLETVIGRLLPAEAPAALDAVAKRYRWLLQQLLERPEGLPPLYDGIADLVRRLDAAGVLVGVCTGRSRPSLSRILAGHGLARRFATLQTGDRHPGKPHPAMLEAALEETGVAPARAVMVGDTSFDIEMARNAGVAALGVAWGYHGPEALSAAGAARIAADVSALSAMLDEFLERLG